MTLEEKIGQMIQAEQAFLQDPYDLSGLDSERRQLGSGRRKQPGGLDGIVYRP